MNQHERTDPAGLLRRAAERAGAAGGALDAELAGLWQAVADDLERGTPTPPMNARILLPAVRSARVYLGLPPQQE